MDPQLVPQDNAARSTGVSLGVIFPGGCGAMNAGLFMAGIAPEKYPQLRVLVLNTDWPHLASFSSVAGIKKLFPDFGDLQLSNIKKWIATIKKSEQLTLMQLGQDGEGAGGDPKKGKTATQDKTEVITAWIDRCQMIIIAGGAGGGTGGGALPILQKIALQKKKSPLTIVTMPFGMEGDGRAEKAAKTRNSLCRQGPTNVIFNENMPDGDIGFKEAYRVINDATLIPVLFGLQEVIQTVGNVVNRDPADYAKNLSKGNLVVIDYAERRMKDGKPDEDIEVFTQRFLEGNVYQNGAIRQKARGTFFWTHGDFTKNELVHVTNAMKTGRPSTIPGKLEVLWGSHIGDDGLMWMLAIHVAKAGADYEASVETADSEDSGEKTDLISIPVNLVGATAEVRVTPSLARRWEKVKDVLSNEDKRYPEYQKVVALILSQTSRKVYAAVNAIVSKTPDPSNRHLQ